MSLSVKVAHLIYKKSQYNFYGINIKHALTLYVSTIYENEVEKRI